MRKKVWLNLWHRSLFGRREKNPTIIRRQYHSDLWPPNINQFTIESEETSVQSLKENRQSVIELLPSQELPRWMDDLKTYCLWPSLAPTWRHKNHYFYSAAFGYIHLANLPCPLNQLLFVRLCFITEKSSKKYSQSGHRRAQQQIVFIESGLLKLKRFGWVTDIIWALPEKSYKPCWLSGQRIEEEDSKELYASVCMDHCEAAV